MNRDQKAAVVQELSEQIRSADAIFAVDYRGISVADAADLRNRLRDAQTRFRVVKNSLTERASDEAGVVPLKTLLEGPTALAFVTGDAAVAAKALSDAARAFGGLEFKGGLMNGDALTAEQVQSIARLPAREVLHGQLVGTIAAPLSQLVRTLNALIAGIAIQLQQMAEQGLVTGEAPAAAPASDTAAASSEDAVASSSESAVASSSESAVASSSEPPSASETDGEAAASGASASDADATPPSEGGEEAAASEAPAEAAPEAEAAEAPAEVAEEPAPEAQDGPVEPAPEADAPQPETEEPNTEASDAEASEE